MAAPAPEPVLLTGAFGNVGRYVARALLAAGHAVVATDLRTPAAERAAADLAAAPGGARLSVRWLDLTDAAAATTLVRETRPRAVLHLAAMIPPATYRNLRLSRAINVGSVETLLAACADLDRPSRFVLTSSVAVSGSRNPHTRPVLTADTPPEPREQYGAHKVAAEGLVRASGLDAVVLRLGAVAFPDQSLAMDLESVRLEALLPSDGRLHAVDARDVATALVNVVEADVTGRTLLIAGDESHRLTQEGFAAGITEAVGLRGVLPGSRAGDPTDDDAWFNVDWMDTTDAQALLDFQHHGWADLTRDLAAHYGWRRPFLRAGVPVGRLFLSRRSPLRATPPGPADPWGGIARWWGPDALVNPEALVGPDASPDGV